MSNEETQPSGSNITPEELMITKHRQDFQAYISQTYTDEMLIQKPNLLVCNRTKYDKIIKVLNKTKDPEINDNFIRYVRMRNFNKLELNDQTVIYIQEECKDESDKDSDNEKIIEKNKNTEKSKTTEKNIKNVVTKNVAILEDMFDILFKVHNVNTSHSGIRKTHGTYWPFCIKK
jgi:hypothetical protein